MFTGALPWGELHRDDRDEVKRMKTECRTPDGTHLLFKGCPKVRKITADRYLALKCTMKEKLDFTVFGKLTIVNPFIRINCRQNSEGYSITLIV